MSLPLFVRIIGKPFRVVPSRSHVLTSGFPLPPASRKFGEKMPMFSTRGGTSTAKRKKAFPLLVFMVTS